MRRTLQWLGYVARMGSAHIPKCVLVCRGKGKPGGQKKMGCCGGRGPEERAVAWDGEGRQRASMRKWRKRGGYAGSEGGRKWMLCPLLLKDGLALSMDVLFSSVKGRASEQIISTIPLPYSIHTVGGVSRCKVWPCIKGTEQATRQTQGGYLESECVYSIMYVCALLLLLCVCVCACVCVFVYVCVCVC